MIISAELLLEIEKTKTMPNVSVGGSACYDFGDKVLVCYKSPKQYGIARPMEEGIRDKKDDEEREIVNPIQTEETGQPILTTNSQNDYQIDNKTLNEKQLNSILEQKCFIALVTLNNTEKSISKEYTIHFNYAQFTKFKSMERYMTKPTFLIKFLNIN